jgi:hypothetical protein
MSQLSELNYLKRVCPGVSRFGLVLCEIHYTPIHGKTITSYQFIEGHYLLVAMFDGSSGIALDELEDYREYTTDDESDSEDEIGYEDDEITTHIYHIQQLYSGEYAGITRRQIQHKTIRNYHNIISRSNYIKPELGECFELITGEQIVIIKTIWIKIIQRKWRKIFAIRKMTIKQRSCPSSLTTRQTTGKWPSHCLTLPGLKGMLSDLK